MRWRSIKGRFVCTTLSWEIPQGASPNLRSAFARMSCCATKSNKTMIKTCNMQLEEFPLLHAKHPIPTGQACLVHTAPAQATQCQHAKTERCQFQGIDVGPGISRFGVPTSRQYQAQIAAAIQKDTLALPSAPLGEVLKVCL